MTRTAYEQPQHPQVLLDSCPYWIHGCKDCEDPYEGCDDDEKMRSPNCPAFHNPQAECTKIGYCTKPSATAQQRCVCDKDEDLCIQCPRQPAQERIERVIRELEAMRDRNDRKGNTEHLNFHDGVVHACEQAIALLQAGRT